LLSDCAPLEPMLDDPECEGWLLGEEPEPDGLIEEEPLAPASPEPLVLPEPIELEPLDVVEPVAPEPLVVPAPVALEPPLPPDGEAAVAPLLFCWSSLELVPPAA
jgi:hypothetical protein